MSGATVPTLALSASERAAGTPGTATVDAAAELFAAHGVLLVRDLLGAEQLRALERRYRSRYRVELSRPDMGDRRRLFTIDVEGPFAQAGFYANPLLFPVIQRALGLDCILGACSSVVSWPGAPAQTVHRDSESLYGDFSVDVRLPSYALTVLMPLVRADERTGSTRVWPGTHRVADFEAARTMPSVAEVVEPGSALMTDSRLLHGGDPNRSERLRPLLYLTYHRAWFRDFGGYEKRPPVNVPWRSRLALVPEHRHLFRIDHEGSPYERASGGALRRAAARGLTQQLPRRLRRSRRAPGAPG